MLLTMHSVVSAADPCPELPPSFRDAARIPELVRELSRQVRQAEDGTAVAAEAGAAEAVPREEPAYQPLEVQQR